MKIKPYDFELKPGKHLNLTLQKTRIDDVYSDKEDYESKLKKLAKRIANMQELMYAQNRYALLVILQGMDTSGKDGITKNVFSAVNPVGLQVFSFKQPSAEELDHDFLWRTTLRLPEKGRIGIFNRSYYEEVLVVRVHPHFLDAQNLPPTEPDVLWKQRYRSINSHEEHLIANGIRVVKVFLHISKGEQRQRLLDRINEADKNWKFNPGDVKERAHWDQYMQVYAAGLSATSTKHAPWHIVPADDKKNARLIVASIVAAELESLNLESPKLSDADREEMLADKSTLEAEG
jgi:PPK2 family polyphosphate:nucleotide phosphotransferase